MVQVYRKKYVIYIERVQREKANGTTVHVGIHPSKVRQILTFQFLCLECFRLDFCFSFYLKLLLLVNNQKPAAQKGTLQYLSGGNESLLGLVGNELHINFHIKGQMRSVKNEFGLSVFIFFRKQNLAKRHHHGGNAFGSPRFLTASKMQW